MKGCTFQGYWWRPRRSNHGRKVRVCNDIGYMGNKLIHWVCALKFSQLEVAKHQNGHLCFAKKLKFEVVQENSKFWEPWSLWNQHVALKEVILIPYTKKGMWNMWYIDQMACIFSLSHLRGMWVIDSLWLLVCATTCYWMKTDKMLEISLTTSYQTCATYANYVGLHFECSDGVDGDGHACTTICTMVQRWGLP